MTGNQISVLVIAGLGRWVDGTPKVGKIETHVQPIAYSADTVDFVCTGPKAEDTEGITYHQVEPSKWKLLTLVRQLLVALKLALRNDYDLIVSFSLIPYGVFALICGTISRTSTHLGIIGSDLDVHAEAWYGPVVQWLFRRFDAVTVAGEEFQRRVADCGVPPSNVFTVLHPVRDTFSQTEMTETFEYDILWLTRVSEVKDPLLFVDVLAELRDRSVEFSAALVGSGSIDEEVTKAIEKAGLEDHVDVPGWTDTPEEYYRNSKLYVMTSRREMLPLTLVEAMLVEVPPVVPAVGGIPDLVHDGENGIVVEQRDVNEYADVIEELLKDDRTRCSLASSASDIESKLTYESVGESWRELLTYTRSKNY